MCRRCARWPGPPSRSPACSTSRAAAVCGSAWAWAAGPRRNIRRRAAGLAGITAASMERMFGVPADRARQLAIGGTPSQVADHLARYAEAGAELLAVTCYPAPMEQSWELLADTRRLLNQP